MTSRARRGVMIARGALLGAAIGYAARRLGFLVLPWGDLWLQIAGGALLGALASRRRGSRLALVAAAALGLGLLGLVLWTPLVEALLPLVVRRELPVAAPAVVVLASDIAADGTPDNNSKNRLRRGIELLEGGYAATLVLTRHPEPKPSYRPYVERELAARRLAPRLDEVGPVRTTYDEARAVAALARERGWRRVLLVSDPTHMRRAGALFRRAGLDVVSVPGEEWRFHTPIPETPRERRLAFRRVFYEVFFYWAARLLGRTQD